MTKKPDDLGPSVSRRGLLRATGEAGLAGAFAMTAIDKAQAAPTAAPRRFEGRIAIVTGSARGQGRAHAVRLAREGASVVLCDILEQIATIDYPLATQADMDETVKQVQAAGAHCLAIKADVRDPKAVAHVVEQTLKQFGKVDVLLANAGILGNVPLTQISDQAFEDTIRTNLVGTFNCLRAVIPSMTERKYGRIVATSSQAGRMGYEHLSHYAASKWGIIGLVKSAALEVAKDGITVNAVCPTSVNTMMGSTPALWKRVLPNDPAPTREKFEAFMRQHPSLPQGIPWVEPEDVSEPVLFLSSDAAERITGSVIDIQAGAGARNVA